MGKNPAFQFYPSDWTRDLDDHDLEVEGAWIRIICRLWWSETRGEATKPIAEWARILRKTEQKTMKIFQILLEKHIADGAFLDNQIVNLISRRMKRDHEISQIRYKVGILGGNPALKKSTPILVNQSANQNARSSSSSSSSTSDLKKSGVVYSDDFLMFWNNYPKKVGKDAAWKSWQKQDGNRPDIEIIISVVAEQSKSDQWKKENGQFIPNPATWINQGRWADEVGTTKQQGSW